MFRKSSPQAKLFETSNLIPLEKAERLMKTWAEVFRTQALPLIDEEPFAGMYREEMGRPNKPVRTVLGVLLLKEMFNLTDEEALNSLEYNLQWQYALRLTPEDAHLCQKTLHNFRAGMMRHELGKVAFEATTDAILKVLGVEVKRQRLDSTHIVSNIASLTRLGLFCETIRVFLTSLKDEHPRLFGRVPGGLLARYLKEDGTATEYGDARSSETRRRLAVCARDVYRLVSQFRGTAAAELEGYGLLERLLKEQCQEVEREERPSKEDDDAGEGGVRVRLKEAKELSGDSLQTPHDPDVTYSGHKGKGYEVQVAETCHPDNEVEIITDVAVTDSCYGDACATIPTIEALAERGIQPDELVADTSYGSAENAVEAARLGTELVSPVGGSAEKTKETPKEKPDLSAADFDIDPGYQRQTACLQGHQSIWEQEQPDDPDKVAIGFAKEACEACPKFVVCPARFDRQQQCYVLKVDLKRWNLETRRRAEARGEFAPRYKIRAGIEGTNSELKRRHGLGKLRIRGRPRVELVVYLKALACNIKRMAWALIPRIYEPIAAAA